MFGFVEEESGESGCGVDCGAGGVGRLYSGVEGYFTESKKIDCRLS